MIVFDKNCLQSFENVDYWVEEANKHCSNRAVQVLIGNKSDLPDVVSNEQGEEKARILGMEYMETSAKTGYQVDAAFMNLLRQVIKRRVGNKLQLSPEIKISNAQNSNANYSCC